MLDNYKYQFKHFDPVSGELPDPYAVMFVEEITRARKILNGLSRKKIENIALSINKIIKDKKFIDPTDEDLKSPTTKVEMFGQIFDMYPSTNNIEGIYKNVNNVNLADYLSSPGIGWEHVFATLALFYAERVSSYLTSQRNWDPDFIFPQITTDEIINKAKEYMQEARQAITFAEVLLNQPNVLKEHRSKLARLAVQAKQTKKINPLKDLVIREYLNDHQARSNREASKRILNSLVNKNLISLNPITSHVIMNEETILRTDDPEKRFEVWIGNYKKSQT